MTLLKLQLSCPFSRAGILADQATSVEFIRTPLIVMICLKFLRSAAQETAEVNFPQKSSFTLSSKEIAMLYSVHLGIFTIMSNHLVSSFFSPEILKKNEVWSCNHDTKASQNCPKGFTRYLQ